MSTCQIGIRKESDHKRYERRAPLTPRTIRELLARHPELEILVERSQGRGFTFERAFSDDEYRQAGARLVDHLDACPIHLGVKEIPLEDLRPGKTYVFFSHTHKGQSYNMPMFARLMELGCTLVDYELICECGPGVVKPRRLVHFGAWAGRAGALTSLWTLSQRWTLEGFHGHPLEEARPAMAYSENGEPYGRLDAAEKALARMAQRIRTEGLPQELTPVIFGVSGRGNTARGALSMLQQLPVRIIPPEDIPKLKPGTDEDRHVIYLTQFLREHTADPEQFEGRLRQLTMFINGITWNPGEPRLITREFARERLHPSEDALRVIGDVTCDPGGSVEFSWPTYSDRPSYTYHPERDDDPSLDWLDENDRTVLKEKTCTHEVLAEGLNVMAVTNLPCALPREASQSFSEMLAPHIPALCRLAASEDLAELEDLPEIQRAVLLYRGEIPEAHAYMAAHLRAIPEGA